jgi:hypothetical protein
MPQLEVDLIVGESGRKYILFSHDNDASGTVYYFDFVTGEDAGYCCDGELSALPEPNPCKERIPYAEWSAEVIGWVLRVCDGRTTPYTVENGQPIYIKHRAQPTTA